MPALWPQDTLREILAQAEVAHCARVECPTGRDAELLRFALYNFRKQHKIGLQLGITLDENVVVVEKRSAPTITILQPVTAE